MSARIQSTFPAFELTLIVALVLIGWAALKVYELGPQVSENQQAITEVRDQYLALAESIQTNVNQLDDALTNFLENRNAAEVTRFQKVSDNWQLSLRDMRNFCAAKAAESRAAPTNSGDVNLSRDLNELESLLGRVENSSSNYTKSASYLMAHAGPSPPSERYTLRQHSAQRAKQNLSNLARKARVHGEALDLVLAGSEEQIGTITKRIRDLRLGLLLAVVVLSFLLMLVLYRGKIAQTRAIIQEHNRQRLKQQATLDKLTHFGQLAQELAHEIKQPLTAMNARAYTLQKTLVAGTDAHKDAAVIRSEIKRLDEIVKDFLELARPAEPKLIPLDGEKALEEVRDLMAAHLAQDSIEFKFQCEPHLEFLGDLQQLKQVLINLLKNAAESLGENGTVTLRGRKEKRPFRGEDGEVAIIEVQDTGPGIPPEIQAKIFDPFFSTKGDGTGLGLAIAARIIDKHGGNLEFDTELGKGTIFRIVLPAIEKEQVA